MSDPKPKRQFPVAVRMTTPPTVSREPFDPNRKPKPEPEPEEEQDENEGE